MLWRRFCGGSGILALAFALVGCGGGGGTGSTIRGTVNFDGQPLSKATVNFEGEKRAGSATTDDQGKFEIAISGAYALEPGKYVVLITKYTDKKGNVPPLEELEQLKAAGMLKVVVPPKYGDKSTTPFTNVEIKQGANELPPFDLKSK